MTPKTPKWSRLLALASFLDTLPPEQFDFSKFVAQGHRRCNTACATVGCAVGWLPKLDPDNWCWEETGSTQNELGISPIYCNSPSGTKSAIQGAAEYFSLGLNQAMHLFYPAFYSNLQSNATPSQVADHIRKFYYINSN